MHRDMSHDLDATFATRGAGELQREVVTKSRMVRSPGLNVTTQPAQAMAKQGAFLASDVHKISKPSLYRVVGRQGLYKPMPNTTMYTNLDHGIGKPAGDMAGLGDISLFGQTVSVSHLAIGGAIALAAWYMLRGHKRHRAA